MKLSVKFFSSLYIPLLCASISSSVSATQAEKPERWFEIEVILFKQLGDKKALKEQFPDGVSSTGLPQYKDYFDLLSSNIQPNLTGIKQFMPVCGDKDTPDDIFASLPKISPPFSDALKEIEHVDSADIPKFLSENNSAIAPVLDLQDKLTDPVFSTQNICIITHKDFENLLSDEQLAYFKLDGFDVKALPSKLKASGIHINNSPYLIANESLLLDDIKQRLQWSKEFKPLLHFGWRQVGVTRNKAIPLKLFAGKHLDYQYQQALNNYQSMLNKNKLAEQLNTLHGFDSELVEKEQNKPIDVEIKRQKLAQVFSEFDKLENTTTNQLIDELNLQTFEMLIDSQEINIEQSAALKTNKQPVEPLQPWFLDGFLQIHLDHYLYITADFNILSQSVDENNSSSTNTSANKTNVKLISFSQNKRAITGEIHYFDHPYIGMIVQIRRFDPSKPKDEAVTQVIN